MPDWKGKPLIAVLAGPSAKSPGYLICKTRVDAFGPITAFEATSDVPARVGIQAGYPRVSTSAIPLGGVLYQPGELLEIFVESLDDSDLDDPVRISGSVTTGTPPNGAHNEFEVFVLKASSLPADFLPPQST